MKDDIKQSLREVTPDLTASKARVRQRVLAPAKAPRVLPRIAVGCILLLSLFLLSVFAAQSTAVQSYSPETIAMYFGDEEQYWRDLVIAQYGARQGVDMRRSLVKEKIDGFVADFPTSFEKKIQQRGVTVAQYKRHYLTLQAQKTLTYEALLPVYKENFPRVQEELLYTLLLFDAAKALQAPLAYGEMQDIEAVVVNENDHFLTVLQLQPADFLEEQLIIYPKDKVQSFQLGDSIVLKNSYIITKFRGGIRKYAVSSSIEKTATQPVPLVQKQVTKLLEQANWQVVQPTTKPVATMTTAAGEYFVWQEGSVIIGDGKQGIVMSPQVITEWLSAWQAVH